MAAPLTATAEHAEGVEDFAAADDFPIPHAEFIAAIKEALTDSDRSHKQLTTTRDNTMTGENANHAEHGELQQQMKSMLDAKQDPAEIASVAELLKCTKIKATDFKEIWIEYEKWKRRLKKTR